MRRFHEHGILVQGFFIFGFDNEDQRIFKTAETHIKQMGLEDALLYILTPYPGTPIYDQLKGEGRLLLEEREKYGWANAVFQPARMTAQELEQGVQRDLRKPLSLFQAAGAEADPEVAAFLHPPSAHSRARLAGPAPPGQDRQGLEGRRWRER